MCDDVQDCKQNEDEADCFLGIHKLLTEPARDEGCMDIIYKRMKYWLKC